MHLNKIFFLGGFLFLGLFLSAQQNEMSEISYAEDSLAQLFDSLYAFNDIRYIRNDAEKNAINKQIVRIFNRILYYKQSFSYPFSKLKKLSVLSDKRVRIYVWDTQLDDHSHVYHAFLQYRPNKRKFLVYRLHDYSNSITNPLFLKLKPETWYGCLYYQMITKKYRGKYYYTLIGWDGNNLLTSKKIIDVLTFTASGKPRFGEKIFMLKQRKRPARIIYEFSAKTTMVIHYDAQRDTLFLDHLSPSKPEYTGLYQFYGPDFSYDGLYFRKGKWYINEDIKPHNEKQKAIKKTTRPMRFIYNPK